MNKEDKAALFKEFNKFLYVLDEKDINKALLMIHSRSEYIRNRVNFKKVRKKISKQRLIQRALNHTDNLLMSVSDSKFGSSYRINLDILLGDDWSDLFQNVGDDVSCYYVYAHVYLNHCAKNTKSKFVNYHNNKIPLTPFYIGKGKGDRSTNMSARSKFHVSTFNDQLEFGSKEECVYTFATGLTERKALEMESKLIYFYGPASSKYKPLNCMRKGSLLNNRYEPSPSDFVDNLELKE